MFLSDSHLPQLLEPWCYADPDFARKELAELFIPAWHCVGVLAEFPKEGDFRTITLLDRPLILWRKGDGVHVFLNVCAHRFSKLTDRACGNADRLTCQYHGWQYDQAGYTQRIPDAQSFRPLGGQGLGLKKLKTLVCGQAVFASLNNQARLDATIPRHAQTFRKLFGENRRLVFGMQQDVAANWKVVLENAVESYHVGCVHESSFGRMPSAESCMHELGDDYSCFTTEFPSQAHRLVRQLERLVHRLLGMPYVEKYQHSHLFPNLTIATSKMFSTLILVEPLSPTRSRLVLRLFGDPGNRRNPAARMAFWLASRFAAREVRRVIQEDLEVLPSIQAGLQSPDLPQGGLISVREERVYHFQSWLQARLGL